MNRISNSEILFILNPNSGRKNTDRIIKGIKKIDPDISYTVTNDLLDVEKVFNERIEKFNVFVIVGGDGSVNEAVKYLVNHPDKSLAVYPTGSGNGFAYELGFKKNLKTLITGINRGETISLDILEINKYLCVNTAGVGFDSHVALAFSKTKKRGFWNYALLSFRSVFTFKPFRARLSVVGVEHSGIYQMITIANTRQFGNNAFIAPMARPDDGFYEVVLIKPFPAYFYPFFVARVFLGNLRQSKYIEYIRTDEALTIETDFKELHVDGNPHPFDGEINVSIRKNQLTVIRTTHRKKEKRGG